MQGEELNQDLWNIYNSANRSAATSALLCAVTAITSNADQEHHEDSQQILGERRRLSSHRWAI